MGQFSKAVYVLARRSVEEDEDEDVREESFNAFRQGRKER